MTYAEAVADAQKRRAEGFMGRVKLPGEMSEEEFNTQNDYKKFMEESGETLLSTNPTNISIGSFTGQQPTGSLPIRDRASYDKLAAESAAKRAEGFLGQVVLPGEESFEDYMAFGPLGIATNNYQVGGAGPNGPNIGGSSGQLPGMGLDNFGPGGVDPRIPMYSGSSPFTKDVMPVDPGRNPTPNPNPVEITTTPLPSPPTTGISNLSDGIGAQLRQLFQQYMGGGQRNRNNYSNPMQQYRTAVTDTDEYKAYNDYASGLGPN